MPADFGRRKLGVLKVELLSKLLDGEAKLRRFGTFRVPENRIHRYSFLFSRTLVTNFEFEFRPVGYKICAKLNIKLRKNFFFSPRNFFLERSSNCSTSHAVTWPVCNFFVFDIFWWQFFFFKFFSSFIFNFAHIL